MLFDDLWAHAVAGSMAGVATAISLWQIVQHLRFYSEPVFQRYIVRLIFLVPVYASCSFASLMAPSAAVYVSAFRDCYEAWVIYNFMSLCLAYVGGAGAVDVKMRGYVLKPSWWTWTCCLPPVAVNGYFVRATKQGALQFVFIKPILAVLTVVLAATGHYEEGQWTASNGYPYLTVIYNITYSTALYALLLFYLGTHELLAPFKPLLKFILIKSVIFLTYWQSFFIGLASAAGAVESSEEATNIQNWLVCVEMLLASLAMLFAFPHADYKIDTGSAAGGAGAPGIFARGGPGGDGAATDAGGAPRFKPGLFGGSVTHAISIRDIVSDTVHQFAPAYHEYVLYSDGGAGGDGDKANAQRPPRTVRTRTFVAVGAESSAGRGLGHDARLASMELGGMSAWTSGGGRLAGGLGESPAAAELRGAGGKPLPADGSSPPDATGRPLPPPVPRDATSAAAAFQAGFEAGFSGLEEGRGAPGPGGAPRFADLASPVPVALGALGSVSSEDAGSDARDPTASISSDAAAASRRAAAAAAAAAVGAAPAAPSLPYTVPYSAGGGGTGARAASSLSHDREDPAPLLYASEASTSAAYGAGAPIRAAPGATFEMPPGGYGAALPPPPGGYGAGSRAAGVAPQSSEGLYEGGPSRTPSLGPSSPPVITSKYLEREVEDPFAEAGGPKARNKDAKGWDDVRLDG